MRAYGKEAIEEYHISATKEESEYGEISDSNDQYDAVKLEINGESIYGFLNYSNKVDCYKFTIDKTSDVKLKILSEMSRFPSFYLKDSDGWVITDYVNASGNMHFTLNKGEYFLLVERDSYNCLDSWGIYSITLSAEESQYSYINKAPTEDEAIEIEVDTPKIAANMTKSHDVDYFTFEVNDTKDIRINCECNFNNKPDVSLYSDESTFNSYTDENGIEIFSLSEGKYYIEVERYYSNSPDSWGIYTMSVESRCP